jgi:hypothetical protein
MRRTPLVFALFAVAALGSAACDEAEEAVEEVQEKAGEAGARGAAEGFRVSLKTEYDDDSLRNVKTLQAAADNLPGDPDIRGIDDADGDDVDDDGYVQVNVSDESACVKVPKSGDNVDVNGGACPSR